jgi:hypothetical protein
MSNRSPCVTGVIASAYRKGSCDGVAKADAVGLHLGPGGETTKTHAATVTALDAAPAATATPIPQLKREMFAIGLNSKLI